MITQTIYPNGVCRQHSDIQSARRSAIDYITICGPTRTAVAIRTAKDLSIIGWIAYNHHNRYTHKQSANKLLWITHRDGISYYQTVNEDGSLKDFPIPSF